MTLGESIKVHRMRAGLTQKDLSERLLVSFQTISKWENDINEPDIATLRKMCEIFTCSFDDLINPKTEDTGSGKGNKASEKITSDESSPEMALTDNNEEPKALNPTSAEPSDHEMFIPPEAARNNPVIGYCVDCKKEIHQQDHYQDVQRTSSGMDVIVHVCEDCEKKHQELDKKFDDLNRKLNALNAKKETDRFVDISTKMLLIWSAIAALAIFAVSLTVCLVKIKTVGVGWAVGLPILLAAGTFADVYCIFDGSYISDVFLTVASWSVKFPGLIFTWDLDGVIWLIGMKILFAILGFCVSVFVFLAAFGISSVLSLFSFIPILIRDLSEEK